MVVSILTRKVRLKDRKQWQSALTKVLPRIMETLEASTGFISVQYAWGTQETGETAQITTWKTIQDCHRYVREGAAATVATIEEAALPTAPHPDGRWTRQTFELVNSGA